MKVYDRTGNYLHDIPEPIDTSTISTLLLFIFFTLMIIAFSIADIARTLRHAYPIPAEVAP